MTPAWGLFGGENAIGPDVVVNPGKEGEKHLLKVNSMPIDKGTVVLTQTGGGGGFGRARARDPQHVLDDVIDGYVTREGAERDYGVVITKNLTIDEKATANRRKNMKAEA